MQYNYERLLEDAHKGLPERKQTGERSEIPKAEVFIEGNKTIIKNFDYICEKMRRDRKDVAKFLFKELAVPGVLENNALILQGKVSERLLNEKIALYCNYRVICKECKKPDTRIEGVKSAEFLVCEACGARSSIRK